MKHRFKFLHIAMCMVLSLTVVLSSCKDYDDDINGLREKDTSLETTLNALNTQVTTLNTALDAAKAAAAEAKTQADAAKKAGDDAAAAAAEAKAAVETAKAAAISEAKAYAESLVADLASQSDVDALKTQLETLSGKVSGIDTKLNKLGEICTMDALTAAKEALQTQISTLEEYVKGTGVPGDASISGAIETLKNRLGELEIAVNGKITEAQAKQLIQEENKKLLEQLGIETGSKISTLFSFLSARLTSVTLVPDLYIDGIEAIEFQSLKYVPLVFNAAKGWIESSNAANILSNGETTAHYRLNPTGVQDEDIELPTFVSNQAVSRTKAGGGENTPIKVDSYDIDPVSGILNVKASKTVTGSLELSGDNIWTVALKVPLAEKHLVEGETEAYVYSEYVRLAESVVKPEIAVKPYTCTVAPNHYSDSATIYASKIDQNELVAKVVEMDKKTAKASLDLYDLVTGCAVTYDGTTKKHNGELTREKLESYGLYFRFAVAEAPYSDVTNSSNQQEFAIISENSLVIPKLPNGVTNNFAAAGKEPIIRVSLVDEKNDKVVDVRYLKIKWSKEGLGDKDLGTIKEDTKTLGCKDVEIGVTWKEMTNKVYAELGDLGMSFDEFKQVYPMVTDPTTNLLTSMQFTGTGTINGTNSDYPADSYAFRWVLTAQDIATIYPANSKDFEIKITCKPTISTYPNVSFSLKATVLLPVLPSINGYYEQYWQTVGSLYRVTPVHYEPAGPAGQICHYDNNLMNGFTYNAVSGFIVKDVPECGTWDMQFSMDQPTTGYAPNYTGIEPDKSQASNIGGYNLMMGTTQAARLVWPEGHTAWCNNVAHKSANIVLEKNAAGKGLIGKTAGIKVWATINEYNYIPVTSYNVKFVVPLVIDASLNGEFVDHIYSGSKVDCSGAFTMTDFAGYTVAQTTTDFTDEYKKYAAELYKYYEVGEPQWDTENAKITMKWVNGSLVVDNSLTEAQCVPLKEAYADASITKSGNELIFTNNGGSNVEQECYIYVKVTVAYGWGTAEKWVRIKLLPGKITDK